MLFIGAKKENYGLKEYLDDKFDSLSKRELEIALLLAEGLASQVIADKLFISIKTVKLHSTHIYKKLGIRGKIELVKLKYEFSSKV